MKDLRWRGVVTDRGHFLADEHKAFVALMRSYHGEEVEVTVKVMGLVDHELLEYHWGRDWVVWDADRSPQQHAQHVEYTLRPEGGKTRVRFDITMEPSAPLPEFLIKRAKRVVLQAATEGLRQRVMRAAPPGA